MFCPKCGSACLPEHRFCKSCGAPTGVAADVQEAAAAVAAPAVQPIAGAQSVAAPAVFPGVPPAGVPPAGLPPAYGAPIPPTVMYSGGQPVYYVPAPAAQVHRQQINLLESLQSRIRSMASTDSLEGFSLGQMFSEVFKKHGAEAVENYLLVGSTKTTPPIDLVETGWPKPWLFFRVLAALVIAYVALIFMFMETGNPNCVPGIMFLGAFAVPLATLTLFFELNTPHNVSLHTVGKLFLMGAVVSLGMAVFIEPLSIFQISSMEAGPVEETAKLLAVVLVMRSTRYKYLLNGILFGATVGAGFAAFETAGYALNMAFLPGLIPGLLNGILQNGAISQKASDAATHAAVVQMLAILKLRGIEAPLGHVAWTALAAGAFWRVKQDKPLNMSMLLDTRFLKAFAIPVVMHAIWDAPWQLPFQGNQIVTGLITWYVVFGLVQQGLRQVKEEQRSHLETTLVNVEASLQAPGTATA